MPWPLYHQKETQHPFYSRLSGPQGRSGWVWKTSPPTGVLSPDRSARGESLYRLSCPGPHHILHYKTCMINCSVPSVVNTLKSSGGHQLYCSVVSRQLCWRLNWVVLQCVVTEFLHVIITTQFEVENTRNRHESVNTNADIFQDNNTSLSTSLRACESSEVVVCIGVPLLWIPKQIIKKTPDLWNIFGNALRETTDGFIHVYSCFACDEGFVSFVELTAQMKCCVPGVEKLTYACTLCDRKFFSAGTLERHVKICAVRQRNLNFMRKFTRKRIC